MHRCLSRGQDAKINYPRFTSFKENQATKIPITRNEKSGLLMSNSEQFCVAGSGETQLANWHNVMPHAGQQAQRACVNILVSKESHEVVARWISSSATTSIAYWMQA